MSRPKKADEKPKDPTNITHISINDFLETRNTVVTGLSTLQSAISDLSRSYLNHTDNLIGSRTGSLTFANVLGPENGFFSARGPTPAPNADAQPETKKRKRAPHDKNAPKRALTPFFLYLQSARSTIAEEMGSGHTAKEVQDEGGRRWRVMPEEEKDTWQNQYGINFMKYKAKMAAYKKGETILPELSDDQAQKLWEEHKATGKVTAAGVDQLEATHVPAEDEDSESSDNGTTSSDDSVEPVKAPSPVPVAKKPRVSKDASKKKALPVEPEPVLDPALRSPEKKKPGKKAKAAEGGAESKKSAVEAPMAPTPKAGDKQKKKKRKSTAAE